MKGSFQLFHLCGFQETDRPWPSRSCRSCTPLHIQKGCGVPDKLSRCLPRAPKGVALDRFGVITFSSPG